MIDLENDELYQDLKDKRGACYILLNDLLDDQVYLAYKKRERELQQFITNYERDMNARRDWLRQQAKIEEMAKNKASLKMSAWEYLLSGEGTGHISNLDVATKSGKRVKIRELYCQVSSSFPANWRAAGRGYINSTSWPVYGAVLPRTLDDLAAILFEFGGSLHDQAYIEYLSSRATRSQFPLADLYLLEGDNE